MVPIKSQNMRVKGSSALLFLAAFAFSSTSSSSTTTPSSVTTLNQLRGGVGMSPYEPNPNYVPPPQRKRIQPTPPPPSTLGDLENLGPATETVYFRTETYQQSWPIYDNTEDISPTSATNPTIVERIRDYAISTHRTSPTLSVVSATCLLVFAMWQIPSLNMFMQRHFVCSRRNMQEGRIHSLALSAVSHASPIHLAVNLATFLGLGPTLRQGRWPLWHLVVGATLSGSCMYLLRERDGGGCLGLSGVTLAMLALEAKLFPEKEFAMMLAVIPVRMKAHATLTCLLTWSLLGCIWAKRSPVAHITHLGGLLYGIGYFEAWTRRYQLRWLGYKARQMLTFGKKAGQEKLGERNELRALTSAK